MLNSYVESGYKAAIINDDNKHAIDLFLAHINNVLAMFKAYACWSIRQPLASLSLKIQDMDLIGLAESITHTIRTGQTPTFMRTVKSIYAPTSLCLLPIFCRIPIIMLAKALGVQTRASFQQATAQQISERH